MTERDMTRARTVLDDAARAGGRTTAAGRWWSGYMVLIGLLAFGSVRSVPETVIVLLTIPLACSGGLLALIATGINFSVSAAMGFISIFGIAIQDGILVTSYTQRFWSAGMTAEEGIRRGVERGFRPVLMTSLVAMLGLLPAALSNAIGSQTQKPLAVVVIGGALFVAALTRLVRPPMLLLVHRWFPGAGTDVAASSSGGAP